MTERNPEPIFPPDDAGNEATDANPVPLSPTSPEHRTGTSDGAGGTSAGLLPGIAVPVPGTAGSLPAVPVVPKSDDAARSDGEEAI